MPGAENGQRDARLLVLRVYDFARTAHLERLDTLYPGELIFRRKYYDFDESLARRVHARQLSRFQIGWYVFRSRADIIEVNEPVYVSAWPTIIVVLVATMFSKIIRRRRPEIVVYAIENKSPVEALVVRAKFPIFLAEFVVWMVVSILIRRVRRVAFGTHGACALYRDVLGRDFLLKSIECRHFPALPQRCNCASEFLKSQFEVVFVGAFEDRKGVFKLMDAWELVVQIVPTASLTLAGKGESVDRVTAWSSAHENVSILVDPSRRRIHSLLRSAHCLVLLSQPSRGWREQVGLPILEGLAHGCEIVASTETGIASWLTDHGHVVLEPSATSEELALSIVSALRARRTYEDVCASLPAVDTRVEADTWLVLGGCERCDGSSACGP